jgi:hypothetical protein
MFLRLCLLFCLLGLLPGHARAATLRLDVQPVALCRDGGGCTPPALDTGLLRSIWAQAGVTVTLRPVTYSAPLAIPGVGGDVTPLSMLSAFAMWQYGHGVSPRTAYLGFTGPMQGDVAALAFTTPVGEAPVLPFAVIEAGLAPRLQAALAAQQLGHLMGAPAGTAPGSVMHPVHLPGTYADPAFLPAMSATTIAAVRQSPLLTAAPLPAPLPGAAGLMLGALGGLGLLLAGRRRRPEAAGS